MIPFQPPIQVTQTLAAGGSVPINCDGVTFRVLESTGKLTVAFDLGQDLEANVGLGFRCLPGESFSKVTISNPSANPITFTAQLGRMYVDDSRLNILTGINYLPTVDPAKVLVGSNLTSLAAGTHQDFPGTPGAGQYRRESIQIDNLDNAHALTIYDAGTNLFGYVLPASSKQIFVSGFVRVSNDTGAPINCAIGEVFELSP